MNPLPDLPQSDAVRMHLRQARSHLDLARDLLTRPDPELRAAAVHIERCYYDALAAVTTWHRVSLPTTADVREHARHAVHLASILRTPAHRALVALPTLRTAGVKARLDVHDREQIETGWYTARNLYHTVLGELPAPVSGERADVVETLRPARRAEVPELREIAARTPERSKQRRATAPA